jgi:ssDNA-binding Zn-finger/Zn-ribbon topoisomerase 1
MSTAVTVKSTDQNLESRVVMPAVSAQEALTAWNAYQELKQQILDPKTDIQVIHNQEFKKKSYWRKVATFFNLSIETRDEWKEQLGRTMVWHFVVRAQAPNGRFVDGVGSCDVYEKATLRDGKYQTYNSYKNKWEEAVANSPHNVRSTAYTRAYNRSVSDLIGGGEVSAEEVQAQHATQYANRTSATSVRPAAIAVKDYPDPNEDNKDETKESGQYQCEKCTETIPLNVMIKSKDRYDNHTFCFKHQLEYKRMQVHHSQSVSRAKSRTAKEKTPSMV